MNIERWDPYREMISLRDAMSSLVAESFVRPGGAPAAGGAAPLALDVAETEAEFVIKASLPGIKPDDVHITVYGDTLTIRGESKAVEEKKGMHWHLRERRVSSFARSLSLGIPIHADAASAHFDHGVLTLTAAAKPRQIKVASTPAQERSAGSCGQGARLSRHQRPRGRAPAIQARWQARTDPRSRRRASPRGTRGRGGARRRGVQPRADGRYRPGKSASRAPGPGNPAGVIRMRPRRHERHGAQS